MKKLLALSVAMAAIATTSHAEVYCGAGFVQALAINRNWGNGSTAVAFSLDNSLQPGSSDAHYISYGKLKYIIVTHYIDPNYYGLVDLLKTAAKNGFVVAAWGNQAHNCWDWDNGMRVTMCSTQNLDDCKSQ